ncbi:MAG: hypothetical protein JSV96_03180 [Candidatus Aminicenantes bacterium]|nr:MAG: hypothetical protein JSV96_03180 [Candidatus Aminicenantes bacterium]
MARMARIEFPGAFYHVLARGNNKQKIFKNEQDYIEEKIDKSQIFSDYLNQVMKVMKA